ncbi:UNKNOWN [Stylonychia lemnae]|uniref:Uncharacterized protein n=1 Tax=Stylonychia lemnae TaxID=5949 RepID=A0A077ZXN0_STYLE|nr:UNKNOWN [Stylonychia lemnae]|eukprot:CDW73987.1 UNKNOWN [Stylonychia lemnae]
MNEKTLFFLFQSPYARQCSSTVLSFPLNCLFTELASAAGAAASRALSSFYCLISEFPETSQELFLLAIFSSFIILNFENVQESVNFLIVAFQHLTECKPSFAYSGVCLESLVSAVIWIAAISLGINLSKRRTWLMTWIQKTCKNIVKVMFNVCGVNV